MADLKEEVVGTVDDPVELASLIDKLMAEGKGHVNIEAKETESGSRIATVTTVNSTECSGKKGACCQPTELECDDDD